MTLVALTAVVSMSSAGISGIAAAKGTHHLKGGGNGVTGTWSPTEATLPVDAMAVVQSDGLQAVSCPAAGSCVAVGSYTNASNTEEGLIDTLANGVWTPTALPLPDNAINAALSAVTCPDISSCVALGRYGEADTNSDGFVATLSDGTWTTTELPVPAGLSSVSYGVTLTGLTCPTVGACTVIAKYTDTSAVPYQDQWFIDTLMDGSWTASDAPLPSNAGNIPQVSLDSVACSAAAFCVTVGAYDDTGGQQDGLIETLADGSWTASEAPAPSTTATYANLVLTSIACPGLGACEAIGQFSPVTEEAGGGYLDDTGYAVVETLSAGTWADMEAPLPANAGPAGEINLSGLSALACPSVGSCEAVGSYSEWWKDAPPDGALPALIETLSNGTWTPLQAPLPDSTAQASELNDVTCAATGSCVAVGQVTFDAAYNPPLPGESDGRQVLFETLSDDVWTSASAPLPPNAAVPPTPTQVQLNTVSCASAQSCASIGIYSTPDTAEPSPPSFEEGLIETLGIPIAPAISSPDQATFIAGQSGSFTISATGAPVPTISEKGKLPKGLHFKKGKGLATIEGTPSSKSHGSYSVMITASSSTHPNANQSLTLTVSLPSP